MKEKNIFYLIKRRKNVFYLIKRRKNVFILGNIKINKLKMIPGAEPKGNFED